MPIAHHFLAKPCNVSHLENTIDRACGLTDAMQSASVRALLARVRRVPCLPSVYTRLTDVLGDERSDARAVAAVIEKDSSMCAKILSLANSTYFGAGRKIATIPHAVRQLGFQTIKNLAMVAGVFEVADKSEIGELPILALQNHALVAANIAVRLSPTDVILREHAFMGAMLHDIGKLVLASASPEQYSRCMRSATTERRPTHDVEREIYGTTHAEVGAHLLDSWGLPTPIIEAVAHHHQPARVPHLGLDALALVYVADTLIREHESKDETLLDVDYMHDIGASARLAEWRAVAREVLSFAQGGVGP